MDLQELVEKRIAELKSRSVAGIDSDPESEQLSSSGSFRNARDPERDSKVDYRDRRARRPRKSAAVVKPLDRDQSVIEFCEIVDAALVEVAGNVMEIAERVTEDHTRLEKELLDLRLETLEGAESVMDMALSIRKRAQRLLDESRDDFAAAQEFCRREFTVDCEEISSPSTSEPEYGMTGSGSRASMHDVGVAALFRKTR
jgi:hypothetical protein